MSWDISEVSQYETLVADNPDLRRTLWGPSIDMDARDSNPMKDFIGGEKSGKPIIEKKDLAAGGSQKAIFTSMAPIGGQGTRGNAELKSKTAKPVYGTWGVTVDMRRFAISEDQLVELLRFNQGESRDSLLYDLCKQWWAMMERDDLQITFRDKALFATDQPNVFRIGNGASSDDIELTDTFDTGTIEDAVEQAGDVGEGRDDEYGGSSTVRFGKP